MTAIGMNVETWQAVLLRPNSTTNESSVWSEEIMKDSASMKLDVSSMYFDQSLVSFYIDKWMRENPKECLSEGKNVSIGLVDYLDNEGSIPKNFNERDEIMLPKKIQEKGKEKENFN